MIRSRKTLTLNRKFIILSLFVLGALGLGLARNLYALSPSPSPAEEASPSAQPTTEIEEEKVKEIREAIKEKVNEIKEKVEKKAYTGEIEEITDSTLTLVNFRGKQRVRLSEETTIIGTSRKVIKANELALEDRIIAMGTISDNEILEAKRLVVIPPPKSPPPQRIVAFGTIASLEARKSALVLNTNTQELTIKADTKTDILDKISGKEIRFSALEKKMKLIIVYNQTKEGTIPTAKTIFLLP